jgi:uncharacterized membrane protein
MSQNENLNPNLGEKSNSSVRSVESKGEMTLTLKIALMAVFTAVETVTTMMVPINIPASQGYFNVGEAIIYFTAILFGPAIGAFTGGVGAAIADLLLGYASYAPVTLVVKGAEGFVVGYLFKILKDKKFLKEKWNIFTLVLGFSAGLTMIILGIESVTFIILGIVLMVLIIALGFTVQHDIGIKLIAMLCGGVVMVLGYMTYQIPTYGADAALFELPFNFLQVLLGILIALPLISSIEPVVKKYFE